jgi:hypothetical protein
VAGAIGGFSSDVISPDIFKGTNSRWAPKSGENDSAIFRVRLLRLTLTHGCCNFKAGSETKSVRDAADFEILQARRGSGGVRRCRFSGVSTDSAGDYPSGAGGAARRPSTACNALDLPRNAEIFDGTTQNRPKTSPTNHAPAAKNKIALLDRKQPTLRVAPYVALPSIGRRRAAGTAALQAPPIVRPPSAGSQNKLENSKSASFFEPILSLRTHR